MNRRGEEPALARRQAITRYYRLHAHIYDLTRWIFLWGRQALMESVAVRATPTRILEVGCGTGTNLLQLGRLFPQARLWGLDLSPHMLGAARKKLRGLGPRLTLIQAAYDRPAAPGAPFDLVVFSYALSLFNPGWEQALEAARRDLAPGGIIAVVDFHNSGSLAYKRWLGLNYVRLDGHLLPGLERRFRPVLQTVRRTYGGLWSYFLFLGYTS